MQISRVGELLGMYYTQLGLNDKPMTKARRKWYDRLAIRILICETECTEKEIQRARQLFNELPYCIKNGIKR